MYGLVSGGLDSGSTGAGGISVMGGTLAGGARCSCGGAGNFIVRCLRARRRCERYGLMGGWRWRWFLAREAALCLFSVHLLSTRPSLVM